MMLTTMNYAWSPRRCPEVSAAALYDFTGRATQHARANMVGTIGLTAASVVIAGLVGERVYPDADPGRDGEDEQPVRRVRRGWSRWT